jgi:ElaB/YqjD/DUF883 family membrane-anchored ribosome-binding protein
MASTAQLESEAGRTRGRIEETLSELRDRLSPGSLTEELLGYASENGGADFVRNLGRQVADNPLPVAVIGIGLGWLMVSQTLSSGGTRRKRVSFNERAKRTDAMTNFERDRQTGTGGSTTDGSSEQSGVYGRATEALGDARERASDMMDRARETTSGAYDRVSRSMSSAMDSVSSAMPNTRSIANFMQEEPMVLAGVGIALGAIIGAMIPSTDVEERYLGPTAEAAREQARAAAREQWERGKEMAAEGWDEAKDAARRTWEDAKDEAQKSWDNTQERVARSGQTGTSSPLVPGQEGERERMADATSRTDRSGT